MTLEHPVWTRDGVRLVLTEFVAKDRVQDGPVFLMVPGFAQNRRAFLAGALPAALARRGARVFIGELRGHGLSRGARRPPRWTIEGYVQHDLPALCAYARRLTGARQIHFLGHSLGGLLALAWMPERPPLASLTTIASPLKIGSDRAIVPWAAAVARIVNAQPPWREVPMGAFLGALAEPLSAPDAGPLYGWLQRFTALASPQHAAPTALRKVLATADPESPAVFQALLNMAVSRRGVLAGYAVERIGREASIPWLAIHGTRDIFAPPSSVASLTEGPHAGRRRLIEVPGATHVDVAIGHHIERVVGEAWDWLFSSDKS